MKAYSTNSLIIHLHQPDSPTQCSVKGSLDVMIQFVILFGSADIN